MDLKEIAEAYQLVYEKKKLDAVGKEDDDVDNDGDVDSSDEYLKKRRAAIGKAMGKDGDKEEDEEEKEDKKKDKKESLDLMSAYYSMYEHHEKDDDGNVIPHPIMPDENGSMPVKPDGSPAPAVTEEIDLSFVDELSEEELDTLVEEVVYDLLDEGVELDAIEGAFTVYLEEAKVTYGSDTEDPMVTAVKKRREEKAKASKEKVEKVKKSIGKAVTKMKAKMHGGMADYAGKRGLIPAKTKMKKPDGRSKAYRGEGGKDALAKDKAKFAKAKDRKQTSGNIKVSMMGGGAKDTRSKLRSAVFKDVKDRIGKKKSDIKSGIGKAAKSVADAPKKASERIQKGIGGLVKKGRTKIGGSLVALGKKMQEQGGELDMFDTVTAYLIDEGLVKDFDHAQRVMTTLDSTLIEEVHAEQMQLLEAYGQNKPGYGKDGDFSKVPTSLHGKMKVGDYDIKHNTEAGKRFKAGNPAYKKESLENAYLKVYEEKSTGDKLKDIAKKKQAKYDAQPQEYKNNPAFGDESHHSNAKNK